MEMEETVWGGGAWWCSQCLETKLVAAKIGCGQDSERSNAREAQDNQFIGMDNTTGATASRTSVRVRESGRGERKRGNEKVPTGDCGKK